MRKLIDIDGQRFGHLIVISRAGNSNDGQAKWLCVCDCGNESRVLSSNLRNGRTKSCGCLQNYKKNTTHGLGETSEYSVWCGIKSRCFNKNNDAYCNYGGRGIIMCKRWRDDFALFFSDMGKRPTEFHSIERINNNKNYSPSNCIWATNKDQCRNRRNNFIVNYKGVEKPLAAWCEELSLEYSRTYSRINKSQWSVEKAFTAPKQKNQFL